MRRKILLFMPILAIILLMCFTLSVKAATIGQIDLVYANPAEDSSTSMRFNWHSKAKSCVLHYTVSTDTNFTYENAVTVVGTQNQAKYSDMSDDFYVFKYQLDDLTPDTNYIYKITAGQATSSVYGFKTAGFSGSFNFINYGDLHSTASEHSKISVLDRLITAAEDKTASIGGIDFILSTGDTIKYGNLYSDWQEYNSSTKRGNYMLAQINGNHEQKISTSFAGYSSGQSAVHDWELNTWNNPANGFDENRCEYWFIYNNVLFIGLDDQRGGGIAEAARWADEVLRKNEGKYQYCVVFKHNPAFRAADTTWCDWGGYDTYRSFCDKYGVDLFLCGDDHVYVRTKQLYNDTPQAATATKGTVYMTVPMISSAGTLNIKDGGSVNNRFYKIGTGGDTGAIYFTVTPEKLCIYTYQANGTIVDSYEILAKRNFTARADLKEKVEESLQYVQLKGANEGIVYGDASMTSIVKQISFYNGETLVANYSPSTNKTIAFKLQNLEANKLLNLTAKLVYVDDTEKTVNFVANTFDYFGRISNLKVGIVSGKVVLNWVSELIGNSVDKIKIYRGDQEVGEVAGNATSYQFDKTDADSGARYKLALLSSDGLVIGEYRCGYSAMGDLNYDGIVDASDCDEVASYIFGGTLTNDQKSFADINKDGVIDFGDITYMWLNHKTGASLSNDTVTVVYKAMDGSSISVQFIRSGTNATEPIAPQVAGYTFVGWTVSSAAISEDVTIYPIYSK